MQKEQTAIGFLYNSLSSGPMYKVIVEIVAAPKKSKVHTFLQYWKF